HLSTVSSVMSEKNSLAALESKWGKSALTMGWTAVPSALFFLQGTLSISPVAFNVLLNLLAHWWKAYEWPHPSQESLAVRMSVSVRTVQRGLAELENMGLITRRKTSKEHPKYKGRNIYDLTNLVESLNNLAPNIKDKLSQ
ncbi:helix-turn-helix domain-containing protein, partial [Klebsiella pneumoniae]|uniref:helix-turn-helix domain-containing protein n=1 Tax=Klebsiella pneumoniae TaxID=573 RepID=UPI003F19DE2A